MDKLRLILIGLMFLALCDSELATAANSDDYIGNKFDTDYDETNYDDDSGSKENNNLLDIPNKPISLKIDTYSVQPSIGDDIKLECSKYVENFNVNNIIMWYNGTEHITQSIRTLTLNKRVSLDNNTFSLSIKDVQYEDINNYTCQIVPDMLNLTVSLTITPSIRILNKGRNVMGNIITYNEGQKIEIECISDSQFPIVWSLDGLRIEEYGDMKLEKTMLIIEKANYNHTGVYQCLADGIKTVTTGIVEIVIKSLPKVKSHRKIVNVKDGITKELHCSFWSTPNEQIIWKKDNKIILSGEKYKILNGTVNRVKNTTLIINNIEKADLGLYRCEISTQEGSHHDEIVLTYVPEPAIFEGYEVVDNHVKINWTIHSMLPISDIVLFYQLKDGKAWQQDKPLTLKDNNGVISIQHKLRLQAGEWLTKIKATNSEGSGEYTETHTIIVPGDQHSGTQKMTSILQLQLLLVIIAIVQRGFH